MAGKLRHIAINVPDPWEAALFYMEAFGMKKVGETDSVLARGVYLSDGIVNLAILNYKTDEAAGGDKTKYGIHHMGFWLDDIDKDRKQLEDAGGKWWMGDVASGNTFYEVKYHDPNGIVVDVSANGWGGASKDGVTTGPELRHAELVADRAGIGKKDPEKV